jgi:superfamily I DNA/RNA helicase/RecB family exonuclease
VTSLLQPPAPRALPQPDPGQRRALDAIAAGHALVTGGPGTGKSTVAVWAIVEAVERGIAPERTVLIAPTRVAASGLRDRVSLAVKRPTGVPLVRTAASLAFEILTTSAQLADRPAPSLITGAEQDVILRDMMELHIESGDIDWGGLPAESLRMPAFRDELRSVLMRAAEADLTAAELAELGQRAGIVAWEAAAAIYQEYLDVMTLRSSPGDQGQRFDAGSIAARAADAVAQWGHGAPPRWDLVVVDDYQDATAATTSLLAELRRGGARVALIGNADQGVQGYRGGLPGGLERAAASGAFPAVIELDVDHRQSALAGVTSAVAQRIGVKGAGSARAAARAAANVDPAAVSVMVLPHRYAQSRAIAAQLRHARHREGIAWRDMAVIARSRAQLRALRSDLLAADVPCESLGDGVALQHESAVAPLLTLLRVAEGEAWTEELATEVALSRVVGLDPVGLRRVRRALVKEDREGGGVATASELLVDALALPSRLATLRGPEALALTKAAGAVTAARARAAAPDATVGAVVWAAWEALGVAESWRAAALAGSARDDADLDAIIALLRAAQSFDERLPGSTVTAFLDYLEGQEFAVDSLGARGGSGDAVAFRTPASAAGEQWELVVVSGLEEGVWPDLRLRDSVLGAQRLAEVLAEGWDGAATRALPQRDLRQARRDVLDDETRAFLVAVSRARTRLVLTGIEDGDTRPSRYLSVVEAAAGVERQDSVSASVADLRGAVVALRRSPVSEQSATALALLADGGEAGADPAQWHGVPEPSTEQPFWDEGATVRVSPSRIDAVATCPLRWALESSGGRASSSDAQNTGLLIHEIAAEHPNGGLAELRAALAERLSPGSTWLERRAYQDAQAMVDRLAGYLGGNRPERVDVEQPFRVELGRALVSGIADRVEVDGETARIVDLKTGAKVTAAQGEEHGQLMLYQLAANHGGFEGVSGASGAALVFVGKDAAKEGSVVRQAPIDDDVAMARLGDAVETMTGATFLAIINDMCPGCPVRRSCPAQPQGDQVGER